MLHFFRVLDLNWGLIFKVISFKDLFLVKREVCVGRIHVEVLIEEVNL